MTLTQVWQLVERTAIATTTGVVVGRLLLPVLWRDFRRWTQR